MASASASPSPSPSGESKATLRSRAGARAAAAVAAAADDTAPGSTGGAEEPPDHHCQREPRLKEDDLHPAPACLGFAIALAFIAIVLYLTSEPAIAPRTWSKDELALYNGTNEELPILLSILGSVFDVTKGRIHYGVGGSYNHFAGRDATRAFISGNFTGSGLTDSVAGLSPMEMKSLVDWRNFYNRTYIYVGKLVGTYYYANGTNTKELKRVETKAKVGLKLLKEQEVEEQRHPNCDSSWSQSYGGEVWCDLGYPRLVQKIGELPLTGKVTSRCACYQSKELNDPKLQVYEGCDPSASICKVS